MMASIRSWPKAPRDLLVGKDLLQGHHLPGQRGDVLLRFVDDGQPLADAAQRGRRLLGGIVKLIAQSLVERVEPLGQHLLQRRLRLHGLLEAPEIAPCCGDDAVQPRVGRGRLGRSGRLFTIAMATITAAARMAKPSKIKEKSISSIPARLDPASPLAYLPAMSVRPILTAPDPRLKAVSEPVAQVDDDIRTLAADMFETMYAAEGIGLAAIQVGVAKRILVLDIDQKDGRRNPQVFINPVITWASDETQVTEEGCLSVPDIWDDVERPVAIRAEYLDQDGNSRELEADGILAICLQHEMDHLDGVLFLDHLSKLKRSMALRKLTKAKRLQAAS